MASSPRGSPRAKDGKKDTVGPGDWSLSQTHNPEPEYADAAGAAHASGSVLSPTALQ